MWGRGGIELWKGYVLSEGGGKERAE